MLNRIWMLCMPYTVNMYVRVSNMCARVEHVGHARCIKFDVLLFYSSANIYISSCSSSFKINKAKEEQKHLLRHLCKKLDFPVSTIIKKGEERKKHSLRHLRRSCKKLEFPASTMIKKGEERKKHSLRHLRRSCKKLEFPASTIIKKDEERKKNLLHHLRGSCKKLDFLMLTRTRNFD
jgi:hypothetical protein